MERLARRLTEEGLPTSVLAGKTPSQWRCLMTAGLLGRLRARAGAFLLFPLMAVGAALRSRAEILVPTTNPFILPHLLVLTRPLHRCKVVPLIYDLYPDALEGENLARSGGLASRLGAAANRVVFSEANGLAFIGAEMGRHARARYGEPRRWILAETGADLAEFATQPSAAEGNGERTPLEAWCTGKIILAYVGNMGRLHDWETLAMAIPGVLARTPRPVGVVVAASGPGEAYLRRAWSHLPPSQVRFESPLEDRPWARFMGSVHVSIVTLRMSAEFTAIPSKAFSAMAGGSAILAIAPKGSDVACLVTKHSCGAVAPPGDREATERALLMLIENDPALAACRERARCAARDYYDMPVLARRWKAFLEQVS